MIDSTKAYLAGGVVPSYTVMLFVADVVPGPLTVPGDLTECTLAGYARVALAPGTWVVTVSGGLVQSLYPTLTFTFAPYAGGVTIYGFMVLNTAGGPARTAWGERFAVPYPVPAAGGNLTLDLSDYDQAR